MPRLLLFLFLALLPALGFGRPLVVTSNTLLWDLTRVIGGEEVDCRSLLQIGVDPHAFAPKPRDVEALVNADLFIVNGLNLEPWADRLATSSGFRGRLVVASDGITPLACTHEHHEGHDHHDHGEIDPHAWHDPANAARYADTICAALSAVDPTHAALYRGRADAWKAELSAIAAAGRARLEAIPPAQRKLVTSHDSLAYFARAFDLEIIPIHGLRPDQEPNARQMATLVKLLRREGVRAIFIENTSNPKLPQMLAREAGINAVSEIYTDSLGLPESPGATFLGLLRANLETTAQALAPASP